METTNTENSDIPTAHSSRIRKFYVSMNVYTLHPESHKASTRDRIPQDIVQQIYKDMESPGANCMRFLNSEGRGPIIMYQYNTGLYTEFKKNVHYTHESKPLQTGGTGSVYLCQKKSEAAPSTPRTFVVKIIRQDKFHGSEIDVPILLHGKRDTIIQVLLVVIEEGCVKIFLPYAEGGNLSDQQVRLSCDSKLKIIQSLTADLVLLHGEGIVHFDYKRENVILFPHNNSWKPCIIDYGSAKMKGKSLYPRNLSLLNQVPEMKDIENFAREAKEHGSLDFYKEELLKPVDVFQHGALIYYIYSGKQFLQDKWEEIKRRLRTFEDPKKRHDAEKEQKEMVCNLTYEVVSAIIDTTEYPQLEETSKDILKDLLKKMLHPSPELRPKMIDVKEHDFLQTEIL